MKAFNNSLLKGDETLLSWEDLKDLIPGDKIRLVTASGFNPLVNPIAEFVRLSFSQIVMKADNNLRSVDINRYKLGESWVKEIYKIN